MAGSRIVVSAVLAEPIRDDTRRSEFAAAAEAVNALVQLWIETSWNGGRLPPARPPHPSERVRRAPVSLVRPRHGNRRGGGRCAADTVSFSDKTTAVVLTLNGAADATATVGGVAEDVVRNIENVIGGTDNDTLTGDGSANALDGGLGHSLGPVG